ncbi:ankyrin repeat-containing domain protein [Aspergillus karnatakaensis]|uniref:ankyrin repeat domain-containing protein n=1 Tax=Aspergillus karnatakaensis TaxID=1810916 RepID=UPI003CCD08C0
MSSTTSEPAAGNWNTPDLASQLEHAAENNKVDELEAILRSARTSGALREDHLTTALDKSIQCGHLDAAKVILREDDESFARAISLRRPLLTAIQTDNIEAARLLLDAGLLLDEDLPAAPSIRENLYPAAVAAILGRVKILKLLFESGAPITACESTGETVLHVLANDPDLPEPDSLVLDVVLQRFPNIEATDDQGNTPFTEACSTGKTQLIKWLLLHGAGIHTPRPDGWTPLHVACHSKQKAVVQLLLARNANVNLKTPNGISPLHLAIESGSAEVVEVLLERKDLELRDISGEHLFFLAADLGHKEIMRLLALSDHVNALSFEAQGACELIEATVTDF